jgi:hypothetical protein
MIPQMQRAFSFMNQSIYKGDSQHIMSQSIELKNLLMTRRETSTSPLNNLGAILEESENHDKKDIA